METVEDETVGDVASGLKPFLRWAGGKRSLASRLVAEITKLNPKLYIEPFLGGGAVALALPAELPKLLADVNHHLIDCWLCIQKMPATLLSQLEDVQNQYGDEQSGYLGARLEFNEKISNQRRIWARRSALFIYLNAHSFNGLWRTNAGGAFNVPFGKLEHPRRLDLAEVLALSAGLKRCDLRSDDYIKLLSGLFTQKSRSTRGSFDELRVMLRGTAIYADPPYDGTFDGYAKGGFNEQDQRALAVYLGSYASAGAAVWATNADTEFIREIYGWGQIESINEQHSVGSKAERRGKRGCLLIRGGAACQ